MESPKTPLRALTGFTLAAFLGSALCWMWAEYKTREARNVLANAASNRAWEDYRAALRNEWPALDWFVSSLILFCLAIGLGISTAIYWKTTKTKTIDGQ